MMESENEFVTWAREQIERLASEFSKMTKPLNVEFAEVFAQAEFYQYLSPTQEVLTRKEWNREGEQAMVAEMFAADIAAGHPYVRGDWRAAETQPHAAKNI